MHPFLRAVGFSETFSSEHELGLLLDNMVSTYDKRIAVKEENGIRAFVEMSKSFGPDMGIKVCGELDGYGFNRLYYFPYLSANSISSTEEVSIDKKTNGESYCGMADDGRVGISLIFFVQNPAQVKKNSFMNRLNGSHVSTGLSGLSTSGTILLPIYEGHEEKHQEQESYYRKHDNLVTAAKNGNQEAIEALTYEDMDIYAMLSRRVMREDIYSIVDTSFMPYGMESDQYQILGIIRFYKKVRNTLTLEDVYQMTVECNGIELDICINKKDLLGDPDVGRRFKGNIWLQGNLNFDENNIRV